MDDPKLRNQLNYVEGQLSGVRRMLEADRSPADIIAQLRAIAAGAERALRIAAESTAREEIRSQLERQLAACPGACDHCDEILAVFDALDLAPVVRAAMLG